MKIKIDLEFKNLIPPLTAEEYNELEKSILAEGCRDSLIIWNNILIDGHNRYEICTNHKKTFNTREHKFESKDKAKEWIILNQFGRRNLSAYDRAKLALRLKEMFAEKAKENQGTRTDLTSVRNLTNVDTKKELAKIAGVSHDTIAKVEKIEKHATKETKEKLATGEVSINEAYKEIKAVERRGEVATKIDFLKQKEVSAPSGKYDVIVIDPPWQMEKIERDVAPNQTGFDYPTMTEEEIIKFQLPNEKDCHLFMWTTHKHLPSALRIFEAWGVKYVLTMVWHKKGGFQPFGLPQYNCEFVLYGRIGTPIFTETKSFFACFNAERTGHSSKPEEFYQVIRRVTSGKRIDIFNRRKIKGFDTYGNESN